jgi:hypothetical protein
MQAARRPEVQGLQGLDPPGIEHGLKAPGAARPQDQPRFDRIANNTIVGRERSLPLVVVMPIELNQAAIHHEIRRVFQQEIRV